MPGDYFLHSAPADAETGGKQNNAEDDRGHALQTVVPVGVVLIRPFLGEPHAQESDKGCEHIGQRMDGVGDHCPGITGYAGIKLEGNENNVSDDAD